MNTILELIQVGVSFGPVRALDNINLSIQSGEVLAIVGDNGAGKSTLLKVITGYCTPTHGTLNLEDRQVKSWSPHKAREAGIEVVYQDLALVDDIALWRNFFLGNEMTYKAGKLQILKKEEMRRICKSQLDGMGLSSRLSVNTRADVLSGGERQSLAISRAVYFGKKALLLDEPVAALAVGETRKVFHAIKEAKARGLAVIYVDHNMANVHAIADRIIVLRAGQISAQVLRQDTSFTDLIALVEPLSDTENIQA